MRRKRVKVIEGEWIKPLMNDYRIICCDCGLVHSFNFRIVDTNGNQVDGLNVQIQAYRMEKLTSNERKRRNITISH